jgi:superfamily I DNA/RNA helicase
VGRQSEVVYLDSDRDQVVLGTAGSGKTTMAVHRAAYLANSMLGHGGRTLLVTYNNALTGYLRHLVGSSGDLDIHTYHRVARGYLNSRSLMRFGAIVGDQPKRALLAAALEDVQSTTNPADLFSKPFEFFKDEIDWISGHGYGTLESYLAAERRGRAQALRGSQRRLIWQIRDAYHARRAGAGYLYDWWDLPSAMLTALAVDSTPRMYRHVVIDEAQDLPPEAIRSLKELVQPGGTVTLFADYAQQLYGQHTSYAACGLRINRVEEFKENYRNSAGIAKLAIATADLPHFRDRADLVVPTSPAAEGVPPTLYRASSIADEYAAVRQQAAQFASTGTVAILTRTRAAARAAARGLTYTELHEDQQWRSATGLYVGTYFSAKGLEFDAVILPHLDSTRFPDADQVAAFGDPEARERDARLVYVGVTRARSELLVTYQGDLTELLPPPNSGLWAVASSTGGSS